VLGLVERVANVVAVMSAAVTLVLGGCLAGVVLAILITLFFTD
jgi:hypothetical protein